MQLFTRSRSAALLLIIIFAVAFTRAQTSSDEPENLANKADTKPTITAPKTDLQTIENKNVFGKNAKNDFSFARAAETADKYKQENKTSNREFGIYAGSVAFYKDLKGESQKAPVVLFGLRYAWTTKK